jgi:hypothetical protein
MTDEQTPREKRWIDDAEEALNRTGETLRAAWEGTREARMSTLEAAKEAANRLGAAIDQGIAVARETWDPSTQEEQTKQAPSGDGGMTVNQHISNPLDELEEAAQGHDLYRAPGHDLHIEQAAEQAEESDWLPPDLVYDRPSVDMRRDIVNRRQDLYEAMRKLETSVARASGQADWAARVRDGLRGLQTSLESHVEQTEAQDGLFSVVIERAPHLASAVESLREEHQRLILACRNALEIAKADDVEGEEIRRKVVAILGRLAIHRQRGAELLFDTYNVDLAAAN